MLVINLSSVAILWFGAHLVDAGEMQIGSMTAFLPTSCRSSSRC